MIRLEVIANSAVEENILDALGSMGIGKFYTKFPSVYGVGSSGPRMGDSIWPELNIVLVFWCDEVEAKGIQQAVAAVKEQFPNEGIKLFGTEVTFLLPEEPQDGPTDAPAGPPDGSPEEAAT